MIKPLQRLYHCYNQAYWCFVGVRFPHRLFSHFRGFKSIIRGENMRLNTNYKIGGAYTGFKTKKAPNFAIRVAFSNHYDWRKQNCL